MRPKALAALLALALSSAGLCGGEAPQALSPSPRPLIRSTLQSIADYGLSPLALRWDEVHAAAGLGLVALALHQHDVALTARLATKDARKEWLDRSMPLVSDLGEGWVDALAAGAGWAFGGERLSDTSVQALQAMAIAGIYNQALKHVFWSSRPYEDLERHRYFAYDQSTKAMPSGHTFSVFAAAEVYGAEYGRWISYPLAALVGYSRIYNQAHWASDVYVGAVLGIAAGYQVRRAAKTQGQPRWNLGLAPDRELALALSTRF